MVTSDVLSFWKLRGHLPGAYFPGAYFYFLMSLLMFFLVIVMILGVSDMNEPGGGESSIFGLLVRI